jgi:hypothetical protein
MTTKEPLDDMVSKERPWKERQKRRRRTNELKHKNGEGDDDDDDAVVQYGELYTALNDINADETPKSAIIGHATRDVMADTPPPTCHVSPPATSKPSDELLATQDVLKFSPRILAQYDKKMGAQTAQTTPTATEAAGAESASTESGCTITIDEGHIGIGVSSSIDPDYLVQFDYFTGSSNAKEQSTGLLQPLMVLVEINGQTTKNQLLAAVTSALADPARPVVLRFATSSANTNNVMQTPTSFRQLRLLQIDEDTSTEGREEGKVEEGGMVGDEDDGYEGWIDTNPGDGYVDKYGLLFDSYDSPMHAALFAPLDVFRMLIIGWCSAVLVTKSQASAQVSRLLV